MDALKAMKEEIARKKRKLNELVGPDKKYFKREDLIKQQEAEYFEKNCPLGHGNSDLPSSTTTSDLSTSGDNVQKEGKEEPEQRIMNRKEVIRRLRERGEPIKLFGESEVGSFERLKSLETLEPEFNRGGRNDFQAAMDAVDAAYLKELIKGNSSNDSSKKNDKMNDVKVNEMNTTIEEIIEKSKLLGKKRDKSGHVQSSTGQSSQSTLQSSDFGDNLVNPVKDKKTSDEIQSKSDQKLDCEIILTFLKFLLELWGNSLNARPEEDKTSMTGRISSATYTQTITYLKPLFKQLKNGTIAPDILRHLILIVRNMLQREYVKANDAYLQMAIGNSPWPIGVTMVGIHARTGREKIFAQNIAHVLNDETQRKYIQGLKRLMTHCQRFFPTDPSKCVEYTRE